MVHAMILASSWRHIAIMVNDKSIILVSSEAKLLKSLQKKILLPAGYAVLALPALEDARIASEQKEPAIVILSLDMGAEEGLQFAEDLLRKYPHAGMVLLAETIEQSQLLQALQMGVIDFVAAPFDKYKILEATGRAFQHRKSMQGWMKKETGRLTGSLNKRLSEMEALLKQINDGVLVLDDNKKIVLLNRALRKSFDLEDKDWQGYALSEAFDHREMQELLLDQEKYYGGGEIEAPDGKSYSMKISHVENVGIVASLHDISNLKELDRLKGDFVNTVSHDLRSPLTAILGYVELIERAGEVNEQQATFIQRVKDSVASTTRLINDLLNLGRVEVGSANEMERLNLLDIVEERMESHKIGAKEKQITMLMQADKKLPMVVGNPTQLRQVVDNLIGNAVKYTPDNGEIRLLLREQTDQLLFYVGDNGPGIPADEHQRIFEKFYRAKDAHKHAQGTGLGLAIVKTIVDKHHGRIWVDSKPGKGSVFTVVLPIAEAS